MTAVPTVELADNVLDPRQVLVADLIATHYNLVAEFLENGSTAGIVGACPLAEQIIKALDVGTHGLTLDGGPRLVQPKVERHAPPASKPTPAETLEAMCRHGLTDGKGFISEPHQ
jgi:hypothetical protein